MTPVPWVWPPPWNHTMTGSFAVVAVRAGRYTSRYRQSSLTACSSRTPVGSNCRQAGDCRSASRTSFQDAGAAGGANLNSLTGGAA